MIVVVSRVVHDGIEDGCRHLALYLLQELLIGLVGALLVVVQTIKAEVLTGTTAAGRGEGIGDGALRRNLSPLCERVGLRAVDGQTALIELLTVMQDVLAHLTKVDVEVTTILMGVVLLVRIEERIHEPELNVLDIRCLEIGGLEFAHHTAPVLRGVVEPTVLQEVGVEVIRTALIGIVGNVQDGQRGCCTAIVALVAVGEQLVGVDLTDVEVRQLVEVALDVAGRQTRRAAREERVDGVPGHLRTVVAAGKASLVAALAEHRRHTRHRPRRSRRHVDFTLGVLKVVDVRGVVLRAVTLTGNELGKLTGEGNLRRLREMQEWNLVEHVREPLAFLLPVDVQAPNGVIQRFRTHAHLCGKGLLGEVLQRTTELEVLREVVSPVHTHHRLAHLSIVGIALKRHVHGRSCIKNALVQNGHLTGIVVNGVVATLGKRHATCCNHHRSTRHVVGTERDDVGGRAAELSHEHKLILLGYLLRNGLRGVVELGEGIAGSLRFAHTLGLEVFKQILTERLGSGEEHTAVLHGVALHIVEASVRMGFHVVIEAVGTQHFDEHLALHLRLRYISKVHARGITLELHVETELVFLHRRSKVVDVLHHQVPVAL